MKYIKNKKVLLCLSVLLLLTVVIVAFGKNKSYAYPDSAGRTVYRDYNSLTALDRKYSYSTIFISANTRVKVLSTPTSGGTPLTPGNINVAGLDIPDFGYWDGGSLSYLFTYAATDADGDPVDVVLTTDNLRSYEGGGGQAWFHFDSHYYIMPSQTESDITVYDPIPVQQGEPIMMWLETLNGEMDFTVKYFKHDDDMNKPLSQRTKANIKNVSSFYHDIDVPGSRDGAFMGGNEGLAPTMGQTTIFWNKNKNNSPAETQWNKLQERDNGIAILDLNINTNGVYHKNSAFWTTDYLDGEFRFHYGGVGCGIGYVFMSPYRYESPDPIKKIEGTKDHFWPGDSFAYKVGQYVPNNYFNQMIDFNGVFPNILKTSRYDRFEITDTINQYLTINDGVKVVNENDVDVTTNFFRIYRNGQKVTAVATIEALNNSMFYSHTYYLYIPVTINQDIEISTIPNKGTITRKYEDPDPSHPEDPDIIDTPDRPAYINPVKIIVHHYEWDGLSNTATTNSVCTDQTYYEVHFNSEYTTEACRTEVEYELYKVPENARGKARNPEVIVTYYYIKKAKLIVNHYEYDGAIGSSTTRKLCDSTEEHKEFGDSYTTSACPSVPAGYKLVSTPSNANGRIEAAEVVVNYYYNREGKLTVYHYAWDGLNNIETTDVVCPTEESTHAFGTQYNKTNCTPPSGYRFYKVEEDPAKGDTPNGIISKFDTVVKFYYMPIGTLRVHHYEWDLRNNRGTTTIKSPDQITNNLDYGTQYTTSKQNVSGYTLYSTAGDPTGGKINKPITDVIYYYAPLANLTVHHYLKNTTTSLCDDLSSTVDYFSDYTTEVCQKILNNYRFVSVSSSDSTSTINNQIVTGQIKSDSTVVTYYYELKPATVTVHHYKWDPEHDVGTTNKLCNDEIINSTYTGTYNTNKCANLNDNSYKFMKVESTDPDTNIAGDTTSGTINKDNIVITYYYDYKPARVITHHYEVTNDSSVIKVAPDNVENTTYNVSYETNYLTSDKLSESYRDWYEYVDVHTGDAVSGTVNKDEMVVNYYYDKMQATVIAHHYIKGTTTKLAEDDRYELRYHDHYETRRKQSSELNNPNYQYESVVGDDPEGTVNKALIEVTYYYNAIPAKLIVHHYKEGTTDSICADVIDENRLYHETYETHPCENLPDTHNEFKSVISDGNNSQIDGGTVTGTFSQDVVTITYFYGLKPAKVITHHYEVGTTNKVHDDDTQNKKHLDPYTTNYYESNVLNEDHKDWYYYINETSGDQPNGVIDKDLVEVIYYYDKKPAKLTVHHYIDGTTTKLAEDEVTDYKYHDTYTTSNKESDELSDTDYIFKNTAGDPASGTINKDNVDVIYYYELKPATVTVHHYILGTTTKLCDDVLSNKRYKDEYNSVVCDSLNDHAYKFKNVISDDDTSVINGSDVSGIVKKDSTVITYYYDLKPAKVNVHHYIEGTTTKLCEDSSQDKLYKDSYETNQCTDLSDNDYKFKNVISDDHNSSFNGSVVTGTIDQDVVEVTYYYELKPAKVVVHHYIEGTTTKLCDDVEIMQKFKDSYDINLCTNLSDNAYKFKNVISTDISSTIEGSKVTGTVSNNFEVTYYYDLKSSQVIVHHQELDTHKKLAEDVNYSGLVYDEVTIKEVPIEGYKLVQKPENEKIKFTVEPQEYVYYYVKIKFNIEVEVLEGEGEIEGDEVIPYGDDSTPEKIVITPHEEWEISKIIIDGEEIEVTDKDRMVIDNFKHVVDHHKVQVIFAEKPIPVPITGSKTKLIIASIMVAIIAMFAVVKFKFLDKKHN